MALRRFAAAAAMILLILLVLAAWQWGGPLLDLFRSQTAIQAWIASFGVWAPLVSIALNVAQVIAAMIPGQVIALANGYLFGFWLGTLYGWVGVMLGTVIILVAARRWGRPFVVRCVPRPYLEKLDRLAARRGELFFFLIFLLPFLPDDLTCFAVGLTDLPLGKMLALIGIGRLPGLVVSSWLGANVASLNATVWIVWIAGASALGLAYARWNEAIEAGLLWWIERVTRRR